MKGETAANPDLEDTSGCTCNQARYEFAIVCQQRRGAEGPQSLSAMKGDGRIDIPPPILMREEVCFQSFLGAWSVQVEKVSGIFSFPRSGLPRCTRTAGYSSRQFWQERCSGDPDPLVGSGL